MRNLTYTMAATPPPSKRRRPPPADFARAEARLNHAFSSEVEAIMNNSLLVGFTYGVNFTDNVNFHQTDKHDVNLFEFHGLIDALRVFISWDPEQNGLVFGVTYNDPAFPENKHEFFWNPRDGFIVKGCAQEWDFITRISSTFEKRIEQALKTAQEAVIGASAQNPDWPLTPLMRDTLRAFNRLDIRTPKIFDCEYDIRLGGLGMEPEEDISESGGEEESE